MTCVPRCQSLFQEFHFHSSGRPILELVFLKVIYFPECIPYSELSSEIREIQYFVLEMVFRYNMTEKKRVMEQNSEAS